MDSLLSAPFLLSEFLHYRSKCQHCILNKQYTFALNLKVVIQSLIYNYKKRINLMSRKTLARMAIASLLLSIFCLSSFAQSRLVSGVVTDASNSPLIGVNVSIVGTSSGTMTDLDGQYSLSVPANAKLKFSFIGFVTQTVVVGNQTKINIKLVEDAQSLDEVVVIGYGTVKKRDLTGSVSSVKADEIAKVSTSNAIQAMQAKVPGLDIQQSDGQAGSGLSMTLRGNRSISASVFVS